MLRWGEEKAFHKELRPSFLVHFWRFLVKSRLHKTRYYSTYYGYIVSDINFHDTSMGKKREEAIKILQESMNFVVYRRRIQAVGLTVRRYGSLVLRRL